MTPIADYALWSHPPNPVRSRQRSVDPSEQQFSEGVLRQAGLSHCLFAVQALF